MKEKSISTEEQLSQVYPKSDFQILQVWLFGTVTGGYSIERKLNSKLEI